ncbi:E3 ubiquitin-protein ligase rnf213-alpha-like [Antedon mediterranea]|uniref:E3 ubiquitin-protein ligase rnf213-alpha-like n=1 Tax=Antedon mediterranea TaxID=105859 RepID=UPI003AF5C8B9
MADAGELFKNLIKSLIESNGYSDFTLGLINNLFSIGFSHKEFQEIWHNFLYTSLQESIRSRIQTNKEQEVVTFYCTTDFGNIDGRIQEAFSKAAFGVIDKVMEGTSGEKIMSSIQSSEATKYGELFSHLLESSLSKPDAMTLRYQLQWKPLANFLKMTVKCKSSIDLTETAQYLLFQAKSLMEDCVLDSIFSGSIKVKDLKLILEKKEQFFKLTDVMDVAGIAKKYLPHSANNSNIQLDVLVRRVVEQREYELKAFVDFSISVAVMTAMCRDFEDSSGRKNQIVDVTETEKLLKVDKDPLKLNELCCPSDIQMCMLSMLTSPNITFFNFSNEVRGMLPEIQMVYKSLIFRQFWDRSVRRELRQRGESGKLMTLDNVEKRIWQNVKTDLHNFIQSLKLGNITLQSVENNLSCISDGDLEMHFKFFESDNFSTYWIKNRCDLIRLYRQINRCFATAKIIQEIHVTFQLKGDFSAVNMLCSMKKTNFKQTLLKNVDSGMTKVCKELENVTKEESECLQTLMKSKDLISWIKKEIKSVQELNVFVDLAMIQAGETPMEVDRVACLHRVATGFSAFIFNLTEDCNFENLINICKQTWKVLKNDPQLSSKLSDISHYMEWLNGIKESHGAMEVTSIQEVEKINAKGIYEIGKLTKGSLQLRVPAKRCRSDSEKIYTVKELKDLQSKLMLVAGKAHRTTDSKGEIDRFVEIFDGAQDLEAYYHKMCASGNIHFTDMKICLHCDKDSEFNVLVDFCVKDLKPLFGKRKLTVILNELLVFLKESLKEWYDYIDERREDLYHLNFYTTKQLVILQRALAKFGNEDVRPEVYALLSLVRPNCTVQDLRRAVAECSEEIDSNIEEETVNEDATSEDIVINESNEQLITFWDEMKEMVDVQQTMAYIEDKKPLSIEEAVEFIFNSPYEDEVLEELVKRFIDRVGCCLSDLRNDDEEFGNEVAQDTFDSKENEQKPISLQNRGLGTENVRKDLLKGMKSIKGTLVKKLKHLWKNYLSSTKSVDLSDYVSLETLGKLLYCLASLDDTTNTTTRTFPQVFQIGNPNLIVSPARNVLNTVLSVYMENNECLPSYDEVLLCNSTTSLEKVVLLWRRAINGNNKKTYCLVNADVLNYDVSVEAVNKLGYLMKGKNEGFKLVIICNREREDQSHMVAAFNSYRISSDKQTCRKREEIQSYLYKQFIQQVKLTNQGLTTAAILTNQRTCVQTISSNRPGVGKSLLVQRYKEQIDYAGQKENCCITVPLQTLTVQEHEIAKKLIGEIQQVDLIFPRIFHLDISPNVCVASLNNFLFNLLVLNTICCSDGFVWRRQLYDLYLVEVTLDPKEAESEEDKKNDQKFVKECFYEILPTVLCRPPREVLGLELQKANEQLTDFNDPLMDDQQFRSSSFQLPYRYLIGLEQNANLDNFRFNIRVDGTHAECLTTLLRHCGLCNPSWSELCHFARFLEKQLEACESSSFCDPVMLADTGLNGFRTFVVKFMLQMSKDFATPSLQMSDESYRVDLGQEMDDNLQALQLRRRWENSPHPYIFFNQDNQTMTFMGFSIDRNGTLLDINEEVLQRNVMTKSLMRGLSNQQVNLSEDFNSLPRDEKLKKLCMVMGINYVSNPDNTYELTTDNVKKILAIHMRFRCGIPVIMMGETGCGKTRLVRFMCQLQAGGIAVEKEVENMILVKVHGGTSSKYITERVCRAEELAKYNKLHYKIDTILFFDEANTTEAIGIIKEIMCDGRMNGQQINFESSGLKIVAACNPYKRHTDEMIKRLEAAGLGYNVKASKTMDRLGHIPLRQLVYRVQALPPSMLPLVWDFGQLNSDVEKMYIRQIVQRFIESTRHHHVDVLCDILSAAQTFMRKQENECSFVSLRDVERTLNVMEWFYSKKDLLRPLIKQKMADEIKKEEVMEEPKEDYLYEDEDDDDDFEIQEIKFINDFTWALILALGVCYHACLDKKREDFRKTISRSFKYPLNLHGGHETIYKEIDSCQDIFLDEIRLGPNIARNKALKENIFMMIICIELRIPLFLVGKPGSSKSLAKTIVAEAMQGDSSSSKFFKELKQVHMISYQCSPLSTPDGIVGTFSQCSLLQRKKDLNKFVSVVVLDEVGLAEDSPRMPLKTLHPLLEYGSEEEDNPLPDKKVAFIGISNWALDPAKMNRGILVSRGVPDEDELIASAKGICASYNVSHILRPLAEGYLEIYQQQEHDFFGLRDFYSLIKMVNQFSENSGAQPTWAQIEHAIRRNFGGMDGTEDYIKIFVKKLDGYIKKEKHDTDPACTPSGLIKASLAAQGQTQAGGIKKVGHGTSEGDSRYLLVLTEKFAALPILQHLNKDAVILYGSSFPFDQEYTQVCRNINRIKLYMEAGKTVVLLNLDNLYESLYDALNQYYVYFGGQRYVDLGLGTHRVKCRVHNSFRLIVVADKEVVRTQFPIPLINRLEKHFLAMSTMLSEEQLQLVKRLEDWIDCFITSKQFYRIKSSKDTFKKSDAFVGYHGDTVATLVYQTWASFKTTEEIFEDVKNQLLMRATPESVTRLAETNITEEERTTLQHTYFNVQKHTCLAEYLTDKFNNNPGINDGILAQVTTYSRLLTVKDSKALAESTQLDVSDISLVSLQEFQYEQQFSIRLQKFFGVVSANDRLLLIQCDASSDTTNLIPCASYQVQDERKNVLSAMKERQHVEEVGRAHVVFIIQLPRVKKCFDRFQGGLWSSAHIDDLQRPKENCPDVSKLLGRPISELLFTVPKVQQNIIITHQMEQELEEMEGERIEQGIEEGSNDAMEVSKDIKIMDLESNLYEDVSLVSCTAVLVDCIHPAMARIIDPSDQRHRSTERVHLLVHLIEGDCVHHEFLNSLKCLIVRLMKEKEGREPHPSDWLSRKGLDIKQVQENGTFRQACWQHLTATVALFLAEVIAACDISNNLHLLMTDKADNLWVHQLWLSIFSSKDLINMNYEMFLSPAKRVQRSEVPVLEKGFGGKSFTARFPFSWIVKRKFDDIWKFSLEAKVGADISSEQHFLRNTQQSEIGKIIQTAMITCRSEEVIQRYISDFVSMTCKTTHDSEKMLLCQQLSNSSLSTVHKLGGQVKSVDLVASVHLAFIKLQARFRHFSQIIELYPGVLPTLEEEIQNEGEMTLDVTSLKYVLDSINHDFRTQAGQRKWLKEISKLFPLVQRVMDLFRKDKDIYGARNKVILDECRYLWSRITVMKLFFEHVSLTNDEFAKLISPKCKAMWLGLGKSANLKKAKSVNIVVKILNDMNMNAGKVYYNETIAKHNAFRQCCNSFFMEVISQLCFANGTPPSGEVVKRLLGYVTIESKKQNQPATKNVSPFPEDCIDPNPVVRSFFLQLLLQSNLEQVKEHVDRYLRNCNSFMKESNAGDICKLFIDCLEDTYYSRVSQDSADNKTCELIEHAHRKLQSAVTFFTRQHVLEDSLSVKLLEAVSQIRYAFTILIDVTQQHQHSINVKRLLSMLLREACGFCRRNKQAQLYLIRYMYKAYGRDAVNQFRGDGQLNWILPDELKVQEQSVPDCFVILGDMYKTIREAVGECIVDKKYKKMSKVILSVKGQEKQKEVCLLLSVFREITMNATTQVGIKMISSEVKKKLGKVFQNFAFLKSKDLADTLLMNRAQNVQHVLRVMPGLSHQDYGIQGAVNHLQIVLNVVDRKSLTQCLATLMRNPSNMQNSFLPAMPQDNTMEAVKALRRSNTERNMTWNQCPNGHPYVIGDCGRATFTGYCLECNLPIGGQQHRLRSDNTSIEVTKMVDTTSTGHVLGEAQPHGNQIVCERSMNCVATAIVRFLLHGSMLLGTECQHGPQPIITIIKPTPLNVFEFLWKHLHNDIWLLSVTTGKSRDDCIFILHKVIDNIFQRRVAEKLQTGFQQLLTSKNCRKTWEENFTAAYIKPVLQGLDKMIHKSNKALSEDKRLSNDPLMCLLNAPIEPEDLGNLADTSHVWQYRSRITIHSIHQALENEQDDNSLLVLKNFMEKEKHLRFVRYLPDIVQLQRLLINKFNRHIDLSEAITLSISKFLDQLPVSEHSEFKRLIDTFFYAWNFLRQDVAATVKAPVSKECFLETLTCNSNMAILLPTMQGSGLCSTGLVDFLVNTQNEFLGKFQNIRNEQLSKVQTKSDLLQSHLIVYDPDRDLLPLILSQCQYIVRPMEENRVEYNLAGLELQVIERFVRGRAFINCKFDHLLFREDVRHAAIFENLRNNIPQEELSKALQCNIIAELKSYQDLCGCLASLDIAIGFLANYKPEGNMLINNYLRDKLAMSQNKMLKSATASRHCRLKHVLALWQLLAMDKAVRLTNNFQDPFDGVGEDYQQQLTDKSKDDLKAQLRFSNLDQLCGELYEYIVLNLSDQSDEDRKIWPISCTLEEYYGIKNENAEITELDNLSDTITLSHAVDTWKTIAQLYSAQN